MRRALLVFGCLLIGGSIFAQYRWDFGVNLGASNYLGEIGGEEKTRRDFIVDMHLNQTRWVAGAFARYRITRNTAINAGFNYGRIEDADSESENPARVARNLSFRNDIFEFYARGEFTLFYENDVSGRGFYNPDFRLYGFIGAAGFIHNPKTELDGEWYDLNEYTTEGNDYNLLQFAIPAGIGLYFTHKKIHRFGWEFGYRTTFTDYLDDASTDYPTMDELSGDTEIAQQLAYRTTPELIDQVNMEARSRGLQTVNYESFSEPGQKRGDPTHNDGYLFMQVSYSYVLKGRSNYFRNRYSWIKQKRRSRRTRAKF